MTAILDAALEALASDSDASMAEIARRAGVVRATIYVHFPTREALLDAVMEHADGQVAEAIRAAEPMRGEPVEALERMVLATWRQLGQFHNLLTINTARLSPQELYRRHLPMTSQFAPLIERGQKGGVFRKDFPVAWHMAVVRAWCIPRATNCRPGASPKRTSKRRCSRRVVAPIESARVSRASYSPDLPLRSGALLQQGARRVPLRRAHIPRRSTTTSTAPASATIAATSRIEPSDSTNAAAPPVRWPAGRRPSDGGDEIVARRGATRQRSASRRSCFGRALRGRRSRSRSRPGGSAVRARGHARALRRDNAHRGRGECRVREPDPDPGEQEAGQEERPAGVRSTRDIRSSERPMIARPAPISQRAETRDVRLPETAATTNATSDSGRKRSPAASGE